MNLQNYLNMQKSAYEYQASFWTLDNREPVVGSYDSHNNWDDYNIFLFKDFDTKGLIALEYGCGPGRNIVKFHERFEKIDGVDIAKTNLDKAKINVEHNGISNSNFYLCDGKSIPVKDDVYDVVFSVICFQHIACYDIRFSIFSDAYRVLKPGGHFCFQMGIGPKPSEYIVSRYYENAIDANGTNGLHDVVVDNENQLKTDLIDKLNFSNYKSDIRPTGPGDCHQNWIWVQVQK